MAANHANYRINNAADRLTDAARTSSTFVRAMITAIKTYERDSEVINDALTSASSDDEYLHNGNDSPTVGEFKNALRALLSYAVHSGELSESEATNLMSSAGISDATVLPTQQISSKLDLLRV